MNYWAVQSSPHSPMPFGPFQNHQVQGMPLPAPVRGSEILQAEWLGLYEVKSDAYRVKLVQLHSCCKWKKPSHTDIKFMGLVWVILLQDYGDGRLQWAATHSSGPSWSVYRHDTQLWSASLRMLAMAPGPCTPVFLLCLILLWLLQALKL